MWLLLSFKVGKAEKPDAILFVILICDSESFTEGLCLQSRIGKAEKPSALLILQRKFFASWLASRRSFATDAQDDKIIGHCDCFGANASRNAGR